MKEYICLHCRGPISGIHHCPKYSRAAAWKALAKRWRALAKRWRAVICRVYDDREVALEANERLYEENIRLRAALEEAADWISDTSVFYDLPPGYELERELHAVLEGKK